MKNFLETDKGEIKVDHLDEWFTSAHLQISCDK